jgi:hypothetical protein
MSEYFKDGEEFGKVILGMFNKVLSDDAIKAKITGLNMVLLYDYHKPDVKVWVDVRDEKMDTGMGEPPSDPGIKVITSVETGHKLWLDKINSVIAMTTRKVKITGAVGPLLKLQSLIKKFAVAYAETLKEMGREDAIV